MSISETGVVNITRGAFNAISATFSSKISANTFNSIFSNFGGISVGTTAGNYTGISLGYSENTAYTKTAIVQEQINDGAARGHLHFLVDIANDGNNAVLGDSKMMINGLTGNVGIGTSPTCRLDILGDNLIMNISGTNAVSAYTGYYYNTSTLVGYIGNGSSILTGAASSDFIFRSQGALVYAIGNSEKMRIAPDGQVLMNTSSTLTAGWLCIAVASDNYNAIVLKDTGTSYSSGNYYQIFTNSTNTIVGGIIHNTATTVNYWTGPSDQRLKSNIQDVEESVLPLFNDVKLKTYNHTADEDESVVYKGFIAQEMVDKFPEAYGLNKEGYYMYNPNGYIPYLIKAIQELNTKFEEYKATHP
jgi:hypothetical protein